MNTSKICEKRKIKINKMPELTFVGTITQNIYTQQSVGPTVPNTLPNPTNGDYFNFNFSTLPINWGTNLPPSTIRNLNAAQLVNNLGTLFRTLNFSPAVVISSGQQTYTYGGQATALTYLQFFYADVNQTARVVPPQPGESGTATYAPPSTITSFPNIPTDDIGAAITLIVNVYNDNCGGLVGCEHPVTGFTMDVVLTVNLTLLCEGVGLESTVCSKYCEVKDNLQVCYPDFVNYCLQPGLNGQLIIGSSTACQEFFKDYIADIGVDATLDTALKTYCSKYSGFDTLLDVNGQRNTQSEIDLCACNLNQTVYDNLREALINAFPGYAGVPEDERCLFPECVDSPFKNTSTTQVCVVPRCIDIASINNSGTIIGGITIRQRTGACAGIVGGTGATGATGSNGGNGQPKSFWDKYWIWIILSVGILIVLIIVILIIIAAESGNKKPVKV